MRGGSPDVQVSAHYGVAIAAAVAHRMSATLSSGACSILSRMTHWMLLLGLVAISSRAHASAWLTRSPLSGAGAGADALPEQSGATTSRVPVSMSTSATKPPSDILYHRLSQPPLGMLKLK